MATCFDRWEKDPFFSDAEEVQDSADRLESVYRRWIHEGKEASGSSHTVHAEDSSGKLLGELQTALGTAKWQLEELEKAVRSNDEACSVGDESRARRNQFFSAIGSQKSAGENSLRQCSRVDGDAKLTWVQLNEGECDELAFFLSLPAALQKQEKVVAAPAVELRVTNGQLKMNEEDECEKGGHNLDERSRPVAKAEKVKGHRRVASASAYIGSWKISLPPLPAPKVPNFSCLVKAIESTSKIKWSKNGFRKWKGHVAHQAAELIPLRNHQFSQDINACYEKNKGCFSCSGDEYYDKQLYGWMGAFQRQLQRSPYQIQYGRPTQILLSVIFVLLLLAAGVCLALRAF